MGIEGRRAGVPLGRDAIVGLGVQQEMPQTVTSGFTSYAEDNVLIGAKEGNGVFLLEDFAYIVAEEADAHKVVGTVGTGLGT